MANLVRITLSLTLVALVCNLSGGVKAAGVGEEINNYLVEHAASDDAEANVAAAREWLQSNDKPASKKLLEALQQFVAMGEIKCDRSGIEALKAVEELAKRSWFSELGSQAEKVARRIEQVQKYYEVAHARKCLDEYDSQIRAGESRLDAKELQYVNKMAKYTINGVELGNSIQSPIIRWGFIVQK